MKRAALIALVLVPIALWARWSGYQDGKGPAFLPSPDALEYAAVAQSIAQDGQFLLHVGPHRVRPRYPPGWPMLLAIGLRAGLDGADLWRLTALFGAALSVAIALATTRAVEWLHGAPAEAGDVRTRAATALAGWVAGLAWALSPLAADSGGTLMSDEPTALMCFAALASFSIALIGEARRASSGWLILGGLAAGQALTMRPIEGLLLAPPLLVLAIPAVRQRGAAWLLRATVIGGIAALPPILATAAVLIRSDLPAWKWSAYEFWAPGRFGDLSVTFDWRYAWVANPHITTMMGTSSISQLRAYALTYLGWAMPYSWVRFGTLWPTAGWLALAAPLAVRERGPRRLAAAAALWCFTHWLVFGAYFYPDPRFVLAALVWNVVALGTALGVLLTSPRKRARHAGAVAVAIWLVLLAGDYWAHHPKRTLYEPKNEETRAALTTWLASGDAERRERGMPFDPVQAQALGLLPAQVATRVVEWGELPQTKQVNLLRRNGYLAREP